VSPAWSVFTDEIPVAPAHEVSGRAGGIECLQHGRHRPAALRADHPGHGFQPTVPRGPEQGHDRGLTLTAHDRVDSTVRLFQHVLGDERDAVAAEEDETARHRCLDLLCDLDGFGDVGQVVQRDPQRFGRERGDLPVQETAREDLQVHYPHLMAGLTRGCRDPFQTQRLQTEEDLRVHQ
jgi:hypothetical protein